MAVDLPRFVSQGATAESLSGQALPHRVRILLVDDDPRNLAALETILAAPDRVLVRAGSGPEALRYLLADDFAVVLLDVNMPDMDGIETASLIRGRERTRQTPIIFLTAALRGEVSIAQGYALGAVDYLVKPLDPDILRSKVAVFVDLFRKTEQIKQQADTLAETTALLHSVLEGVTEYAIVGLDLNGLILAWNEGARRIYGYADGEVIRRADFDVLMGPAPGAELLAAVARDGRVVQEAVGVGKGGRSFPAQMTIEQRLGADGNLLGYVAIVHDVSRIKEAERQRVRLLQEQAARVEAERARDRLQQVIDALPEGVLLVDADGQVAMYNAALLGLIGEAPEPDDRWAYQAVGRRRADGTLLPFDGVPLLRAVRDGEIVRGEQILLWNARSEAQTPVLTSVAPLLGSDGVVVGGVAMYQDISPIKELESQKDAFLAAASHDLKNPLAVVKAQAQLLGRRAGRMQGADAEALVAGLRGIDQASNRLHGMVDELLDVARLQMGRPIELGRAPLDLVDLVRQVTDNLQPSTQAHQLGVDCLTPTLIGSWDRERLERVLVNLVTNAIKYSPEGGPIELTVQKEIATDGEDWAVLCVRDHGIGIPARDREHVFERFYRASNVAQRIEGAGIGLAGALQIVEQHGGSILVESEEGKGSSFIVRLPLDGQSRNDPASGG